MRSKMGRPPGPECPNNCKTKGKTPKKQRMHRLYVNRDRKWLGVGWFCPQCKHAKITE